MENEVGRKSHRRGERIHIICGPRHDVEINFHIIYDVEIYFHIIYDVEINFHIMSGAAYDVDSFSTSVGFSPNLIFHIIYDVDSFGYDVEFSGT